jgi:hypothetical protein
MRLPAAKTASTDSIMRRAVRKAIYDEGPEAAQRFERVLNVVLGVSKEELIRREVAYKKSRLKKRRVELPR